jgi:hypothetical protein
MNSMKCEPSYEPYGEIEDVFLWVNCFRRYKNKYNDYIVICPDCGSLLKSMDYCVHAIPSELYGEIK